MLGSAAVADRSGWPRDLAGGPLDLLAAWDGGWYRLVAERGYHFLPFVQSDVAFFPLLPVVLAPARWLGLPLAASGVAVANLVFLGGLLLLYRLGTRFLAEPLARRAAIYAALFPFSFVFSMAYPESLALAATAGAGLLAANGAWPACAAAVAAATLARPIGLLVLVPVAAHAFGRSAAGGRAVRAAAVAAGPVALAVFSLYLWRWTGDPLAWVRAQAEWGRSSDGPLGALRELWLAPHDPDDLLQPRHKAWLARDLAFLALYAGLLVAAARRTATPRPWLLFGALALALPVVSGSFVSAARHGVIALPVLWGLAALATTRARDAGLRSALAALLVVNVLLLPGHHP